MAKRSKLVVYNINNLGNRSFPKKKIIRIIPKNLSYFINNFFDKFVDKHFISYDVRGSSYQYPDTSVNAYINYNRILIT